MNRVSELDGLRGLAIISVLVFHYFVGSIPATPGSPLAYAVVPFRLAYSGVDLFFVLSGFLVGGICLRYRAASCFFKTFYVRRAARIVPLYFALIAVFAAFETACHWAGWQVPPRLSLHAPYLMHLTFTQNFWQSSQENVGALNPTWSLAVEEQFYLLIPWVVWVAPRRALTVGCGILIVTAPLVPAGLASTGLPNPQLLLLPNVDRIAGGVLVAVLVAHDASREWLAARGKLLAAWLGGGVALFLAMTCRPTLFRHMEGTVLSLFYTGVLAFALFFPNSPVGWFLRLGVFRWFGRVSYGVYLLHMPVLFAVYAYFVGQWDGYPALHDVRSLVGTGVALLLTVAVAELVWRVVERPCIELGRIWNYSSVAGWEHQLHTVSKGK